MPPTALTVHVCSSDDETFDLTVNPICTCAVASAVACIMAAETEHRRAQWEEHGICYNESLHECTQTPAAAESAADGPAPGCACAAAGPCRLWRMCASVTGISSQQPAVVLICMIVC